MYVDSLKIDQYAFKIYWKLTLVQFYLTYHFFKVELRVGLESIIWFWISDRAPVYENKPGPLEKPEHVLFGSDRTAMSAMADSAAYLQV